jgi:hypothetical protein
MFTHKHHGGDGDGQWLETLTEEDEFAVFDWADDREISDEAGNLYGALQMGVDSLHDLGTYREQIAKFWNQPDGLPWHGFPVWSINQEGPGNRRRNPPPKVIFNKMVEAGLIKRAKANRLKGGHHI